MTVRKTSGRNKSGSWIGGTGLGTTAISADVAAKTLADACARNATVELHYEHPVTKKRVVGKARMLRLDDGEVLIDTPKYGTGDEPIPTGRPITAVMALDKGRFAFDSVIQRTGVLVQLNERQRVRGIALSRPAEVKPFQRRAHFRVQLTGFEPVSVRLCAVHPTIPDACPLDGDRGTGTMFNLSAGGIAIVVNTAPQEPPRYGDRFFLSFVLPKTDQELCMFGAVTYVSSAASTGMVRIGLEFHPWPGQDFGRCRQLLTRTITDLERAQLRRMR